VAADSQKTKRQQLSRTRRSESMNPVAPIDPVEHVCELRWRWEDAIRLNDEG
jgi:hypothetical protein